MRFLLPTLFLLAACEAPASDRVDLPPELMEISGLAVAGPGQLYAHDDERAVIFEIEASSGQVLHRFALGDPTLRGDFEGIAAGDGRVHLITSDGQILAAPATGPETRAYQVHDSGTDCEVEGLSLAPSPGELLILCKEVRGAAGHWLRIYRWKTDGSEPARVWIDADLSERLGDRRFAPSSIEWMADRRQIVIASARERMLMMLDESGAVIALAPLGEGHRQPEGLAWLDGRLLVADEGTRRRPATLTVVPLPVP